MFLAQVAPCLPIAATSRRSTGVVRGRGARSRAARLGLVVCVAAAFIILDNKITIYTSWPTCMLYRCGLLAVSLESVVDSAIYYYYYYYYYYYLHPPQVGGLVARSCRGVTAPPYSSALCQDLASQV